MKGAFLAIYEKIKTSIQHAINDDAEDWSIMPSDVAKEIDGGFKAYAEGLEEQSEILQAEQSVFMQTQAQTLAEHVFDEAQHLTQAQANEIAKVEGKVDKTDFKDHLEDDERHLTFSDRLEINSIKDKASAEDLQRHISNPDVHYPIEITQEYTDVAIDKAKAELLEAIAQGGGSASVDLSGVIDRISDVEGALTAHKNDPSIHFKIEETKVYADAKLQEAKTYTDTKLLEAKTYTDSKVAGIQSAGIGLITFKFENIAQCVGYEFTDTLYKGYKAKVTRITSATSVFTVQLTNVWTNCFLSGAVCSEVLGIYVKSIGVNRLDISCSATNATVYLTIFNGGYYE